MSKPSIFSRSYDQRMKRRRLNIILFLLLLLCVAFFGGMYLLNKNDISIFKGSENKTESKKEDSKVNSNNKEKEEKVTPNPSSASQEYTYTLKNNKVLKIEYTGSGENKVIKGFKDENLDSIDYDISPDKKKAVFVDKTDSSLLVADVDGNFVDITKQSISYNKKRSITRKILQDDTNYVWNGKPHFTGDGKIVYLSDMPNSKSGFLLTVWATEASAEADHVKIGKASKDISLHKFEGFDGEGRLILNTPDGNIYISKDGYSATKEQ